MQEERTPEVQALVVRAEAGEVEAQRLLAVRYRHGEGVPARYTKAMKWFEAAALQGDAEAAYWLACFYVAYQGKSHLGYAPGKAQSWFVKAAEGGISAGWYRATQVAACNLSLAQRQAWLERAAQAGLRIAAEELALLWLYSDIPGVDCAETIRQAFGWHYRALVPRMVETPPAGTPEETLRRYRTVIPPDDLLWPMVEVPEGHLSLQPSAGRTPSEVSLEALLAEANRGKPVACYALGLMQIAGIGGEASLEEGVRWLQQAAERLPAAQFAMGELYRRGVGVEKSSCKAVGWFQKADKANLPDAAFALAYAYDHGYGVDRSQLLARAYYRAALTHGIRDAEDPLRRVSRLIAWLNGRDSTAKAREESFASPTR